MTNTVEHIWELSEVRELLRAAFAAEEPLDVFVLHETYGLSPGQINRAVRLLAEAGVLEEQALGLVHLTELGRKWVMVNRHAIFTGRQYWKDIPTEFRPSKKPRNKQKLVLRASDLRALRIAPSKG